MMFWRLLYEVWYFKKVVWFIFIWMFIGGRFIIILFVDDIGGYFD